MPDYFRTFFVTRTMTTLDLSLGNHFGRIVGAVACVQMDWQQFNGTED
jgi:hypothetical protein